MKKRFLLILGITMLCAASLVANGLSLNSIGARALGMGGAFVGLSNDPTAIYWNPAGLTGQKAQIYGAVSDIKLYGSYKSESTDWGYPEGVFSIDTENESADNIAPNIFATYPMNNLTFGFGVYVPAGLSVEWPGDDLAALAGGNPDLKWKSKIFAVTVSPAVAYKINDKFSIGLAGIMSYGSFELDRPYVHTDSTGSTGFQYEESSTGTGFGVEGGLMYKMSDMFQFGATVRSKVNISMSGEAKNPALAAFGAEETDFDRDVAWPLWAAFGVAVHPAEKSTLTADAQYSQWSESEDTFETKFDNAVWPDSEMILEWKDCTQIRFGAEYMVNQAVTARAGYYYDPAPAPDKTLNILFPSGTYNVVTGGISYITQSMNLDFGLEYLMGEDRDITIETDPDSGEVLNMPGTHALDIFAFSVGLGYNF